MAPTIENSLKPREGSPTARESGTREIFTSLQIPILTAFAALSIGGSNATATDTRSQTIDAKKAPGLVLDGYSTQAVDSASKNSQLSKNTSFSERLSKVVSLVEKVQAGGKLTELESREITSLFDANRKETENKIPFPLARDAVAILKRDGYLSQTEVDQAREVFFKGLKGDLQAVALLEQANPDAVKLSRSYFKAYHAAVDAKPVLEGHSRFGGLTGYNDKVDARNAAATDKYNTSIATALEPAVMPDNTTDHVLKAALKQRNQAEVIDDIKK